jgi:preprotein translocase subunit YajC
MFYQAAPAAAPAAGAAAPGAQPDMMGAITSQLIFIVPIVAIFYFLLIRPQNQRQKKHREMMAALKRGDTVVTQGGIIGKITKISESSDEVTLDSEGTKFKVLRTTIVDLRTKSEPVAANDTAAES